MNEIPKYLYHYTTVDTLELILKNKTFRFNSLENVDDDEEKTTKDMGDFGKYCFVSCWTHSAEQNNDLWKRYTKEGSGVRIKLPSYIFPTYKLENISYQLYASGKIKKTKLGTYSSIFKERLYNDYFLVEPENQFLIKVEYTNDNSLLFPKIEKNTDIFKLDYSSVGKYKNKKWEEQKETRYRFVILPFEKNEIANYIRNTNSLYRTIKERKPLNLKYIDMDVDYNKFKDMEILLGNSLTKEDKKRIQHIVEKYNKSAIIVEN